MRPLLWIRTLWEVLVLVVIFCVIVATIALCAHISQDYPPQVGALNQGR
jgi:hypothetical protein